MRDPHAWRFRAACRGADPDLFHPDPHQPADEAVAFCGRCPVKAECLVDTLVYESKRHNHPEGIAGTMTAAMREPLVALIRDGNRRPERERRRRAEELVARLDRDGYPAVVAELDTETEAELVLVGAVS